MYNDSPPRRTASDEEALRRKQQKALLYRRRRVRFIVGAAAVCVLLTVIIAVAVAASRNSAQLSPEQQLAGGTRSPTAPLADATQDRPAFARFGGKNILLLPVAAADATIIAYQPVSDTKAVALIPIGQRVNVNGLVRFFRGLFTGTPSMRYYQLPGADTAPTSSVLVGAQPDTPVTSPINGVVVRVREYLLFGKYDDVQIDIRPEELGGTIVTLLFINNPAVTIGQRVDAGDTLLGTVRQCPEEVGKILAEYTHDSGSHVYLQVSEEPIR
jgi:murein DD-endopeptidase MepM/ murein hydrolase activator NlpD